MSREEGVKRIERLRKLIKESTDRLTPEEIQYNIEFTKLINAYNKKYEEGIPFQMPYTFEELKEAYETDRPFHTWKKFKGFYGPVPKYWDL